MALTARPLHSSFAAEIAGVDMRRPPDSATLAAVIAAMDRYGVSVYRNEPPLTDAEHIEFSRRLGPIQRSRVLAVAGRNGASRVPPPEIIDQSNLDDDGEIYRDGDRQLLFKRANRLWHTDMSFHPVRATYSLLSAVALPPGGGPDTEFADMRAAYDALPAAMKARAEDLVAEHSYWHSRVVGGGPEATAEELASRPPAPHRIVQLHPGSGRKTLYLASHAQRIIGMPLEEGRALLAELTAFATQRQFVYAHKWRRGDVVIWDNRCTMHRAMPFDDRHERRDVRRTTCRERAVA
ncbi:MAG TPA: TauD/TfdA family dioxygenase [Stellaceae bacterium]|nr:TauD/TfdA family dioxygenase [Stellaceae bacterium]